MNEQKQQDEKQSMVEQYRAKQRALAMAVHKSFADAAKAEIDLLTQLRDETTDTDELIAYTRAIADVRMRVNEAALVTTTRLGQMGQQQAQAPVPTVDRDRGAAPQISQIGDVLKKRFVAQPNTGEQGSADRGSMGDDEGGDRG